MCILVGAKPPTKKKLNFFFHKCSIFEFFFQSFQIYMKDVELLYCNLLVVSLLHFFSCSNVVNLLLITLYRSGCDSNSWALRVILVGISESSFKKVFTDDFLFFFACVSENSKYFERKISVMHKRNLNLEGAIAYPKFPIPFITLVRANLTRVTLLNSRKGGSRLIFSVTFSYFIFIFYLPWCTLPDIPSVSSLASLPF